MRNILISFIGVCVLLSLQLMFKNYYHFFYDQEKNSFFSYKISLEQINTSNLLSNEEMVNIFGGCSGGTCSNYPHSCPSDCTHHNADQCKGSIGNCVDDGWVLLCDCPTYYEMTDGCE